MSVGYSVGLAIGDKLLLRDLHRLIDYDKRSHHCWSEFGFIFRVRSQDHQPAHAAVIDDAVAKQLLHNCKRCELAAQTLGRVNASVAGLKTEYGKHVFHLGKELETESKHFTRIAVDKPERHAAVVFAIEEQPA